MQNLYDDDDDDDGDDDDDDGGDDDDYDDYCVIKREGSDQPEEGGLEPQICLRLNFHKFSQFWNLIFYIQFFLLLNFEI